MNCNEFTQQLGGNPGQISNNMREHMSECAACAQLSSELADFDQLLKQAIAIDVPAGLGQHDKLKDNVVSISAAQVPGTSGNRAWFALAATLLLGVGITFGTWIGRISEPLPQSLVAHVAHEPNLLGADWQAVAVSDVKNVLDKGHVSLIGDIGTVRHAGLCLFRGNKVAHVVVHTNSGPVTVMLLPNEFVESAQSFDESGYRGLLVPVGTGSIAIIGNDAESLPVIRDQLVKSVEWSI